MTARCRFFRALTITKYHWLTVTYASLLRPGFTISFYTALMTICTDATDNHFDKNANSFRFSLSSRWQQLDKNTTSPLTSECDILLASLARYSHTRHYYISAVSQDMMFRIFFIFPNIVSSRYIMLFISSSLCGFSKWLFLTIFLISIYAIDY